VVVDRNQDGGDMAEEPIAVRFEAEVRQVKTMADFTINLVLNLPENCREQAKRLMDWQGDAIRLVVVNEEKAPNKRV